MLTQNLEEPGAECVVEYVPPPFRETNFFKNDDRFFPPRKYRDPDLPRREIFIGNTCVSPSANLSGFRDYYFR
jgi:hypothetical protein